MLSVILAGGRGVRLWPESTADRPKQMCDFLGKGSLLHMTLLRLAAMGPMIVVCGQDQAGQLAPECRAMNAAVLAEPAGRNTAPAVGCVLAGDDVQDDEIVGIFPSDHYIEDDQAFRYTLEQAAVLARQGYLVTVGIQPLYAETGYGYIEGIADHPFAVKAFHEKPDYETAVKYLQKGNYFWNAGIFIAAAGTWRSLIGEFLPALYAQMLQGRDAYMNAYPSLPDISIDYGIAEKCRQMAVVHSSFGWNDIGSWDALAAVLEQDEQGNALKGNAMAVDSSGCLARSRDKQLVLFGLQDMVVVETEDTILVCPKQRSQDIKELVETVKRRNDQPK